jgi:hypothetical protein
MPLPASGCAFNLTMRTGSSSENWISVYGIALCALQKTVNLKLQGFMLITAWKVDV